MKEDRENRQSIGWIVAVILFSTSASAQIIQYNYGTIPTHAPMYDSFYTYSYDRNGNLTQITDRYTNAVKQRLEYNSINKLLRATAGTSVTEYRYDANGNRVEKIGPAGAEKYYGLIEAKGSTKTYYYFLGGRRVAQRTIGGNVYFHQQDHLGSASVVTDQNGTVVSRNSYHEFGSIKWQEGAGGISDYTYNDKRWDKETNFYDYGARAYNAKMFKFTTPDSVVPDLTNPQSLNRYAYVRNNPLKYVDPSGHAEREPSQNYDFVLKLSPHWMHRQTYSGVRGLNLTDEDIFRWRQIDEMKISAVLSTPSPQDGSMSVGLMDRLSERTQQMASDTTSFRSMLRLILDKLPGKSVQLDLHQRKTIDLADFFTFTSANSAFDHNGAFEFASAFPDIREAKDLNVDVFLVNAHGTPEGVLLTHPTLPDSAVQVALLMHKNNIQAKIICFNSCNLGQGNFPQQLAQFTGSIVMAPKGIYFPGKGITTDFDPFRGLNGEPAGEYLLGQDAYNIAFPPENSKPLFPK
ncbi:MAG TPA: RHS repeat-associated core domain-containing protein [Bdellovibrionota bacterium]|nr:RHS repeat-associated core domain-containing protein [Bdellovibrionota bacterium]